MLQNMICILRLPLSQALDGLNIRNKKKKHSQGISHGFFSFFIFHNPEDKAHCSLGSIFLSLVYFFPLPCVQRRHIHVLTIFKID